MQVKSGVLVAYSQQVKHFEGLDDSQVLHEGEELHELDFGFPFVGEISYPEFALHSPPINASAEGSLHDKQLVLSGPKHVLQVGWQFSHTLSEDL